MPLVYPQLNPSEIAKKIAYWKTHQMIGILAKMFGKMIHRKQLPDDWDAFQQLWIKILTAKYTQNPLHRQVLLSTGQTHLVEFDRDATEETPWAGKIIGGIDLGGGRRAGGQLIGSNYMGQMLMLIRQQLKQPTQIRESLPLPLPISILKPKPKVYFTSSKTN